MPQNDVHILVSSDRGLWPFDLKLVPPVASVCQGQSSALAF